MSARPIRPYGDHRDDGLVQISFTLPLPDGPGAVRPALELARRMGLERAEVVHRQRIGEDHTYFVLYARCPHAIDAGGAGAEAVAEQLSKEQVEAFAERRIRRPLVVVGASTGTDTHSVGIDAILNAKGVKGAPGLEAYGWFEVHNLGSQVPNGELVAAAIELGADAVLVSQTVTQQNLHGQNLTALVELIEAEGCRRDLILVCGGPRISDELAKELGFDAGFARGTTPDHVASFLVTELAARIDERARAHSTAVAPE